MFCGIVEAEGEITEVEMVGTCKRVRIEKPRGWKLTVGESISVDGICSTVALLGKQYFDVEYMPQTLSKTTAASFQKKSVVNLERSLKYGDRIHGHFVTGHVDATALVVSIEKKGRSRIARISLPKSIARYVLSRGSIAVNGVSLTVVDTNRSSFSVGLIPHTLKVTNLKRLNEGSAVNIETDMIGRYGLAAVRRDATVRRDAKKSTRAARDR